MDTERSHSPGVPELFSHEAKVKKEPDQTVATASSQPVPTSSGPLIDKKSLLEKLENIPTETLRNILTNQVDLEIRLKHKELRLTEDELGKCEAQMLAIRKFFEVPNNITFDNEPNDFTLKYYDVLNKSLSVSYTKLQQQQYVHEHPTFKENIFSEVEPGHSYRTRSTTLSLRPSLPRPAVRIPGCLYRRTDGVVVKLTCPDCQRSNFSSAQGFLNHSRIAHSKEYTLQDAAALRCGEILDEEFQDEEGLTSLKKLKEKGLDPSKNLNVNEIYFNGLSNTLNTVHRPSVGENTAADSQTTKVDTKRRASESSGELMKKLIKSGVAHDAKDYEDLVGEARREIPNLHLFDDEEEGEVDVKSVTPPAKHSGGLQPKREPVVRSAKGIATAEPTRVQGTESASPCAVESDKPGHPEVGGKYENRLRRRKSRGLEDADGRMKRRKSQK